MDIILYLTELLQTRKTVGIVGLGTLYKKKLPGKYDAVQHAFIPPSFVLAFTTEIKEEEELANYISSKRNISKESANYYISEFAEKIQVQLVDHQEADLEPIGKLKLVNDEITFISTEEQSFGYESYGLPTLTEIDQQAPIKADETDPVIEEEKLEEIVEENKLEEENPGQETEDVSETIIDATEEPVYEEIAEINHHVWELKPSEAPVVEHIEEEKLEVPVVEAEEPAETYFEEESPKKGLPFFMKFLLILLAIVALGAIIYFINPSFFDKYIQKNSEGKPAKVSATKAVDSSANTTDSAINDSLAKNNAMVTLTKDSSAVDSTKLYYEVIGTSYKTKEAADAYIARVATVGIKATVADMPGRRFNISLGTFTDTKDAYKLRDSLRISLKDKGIYIQPIKPKNKK